MKVVQLDPFKKLRDSSQIPIKLGTVVSFNWWHNDTVVRAWTKIVGYDHDEHNIIVLWRGGRLAVPEDLVTYYNDEKEPIWSPKEFTVLEL